MRIEEFRKIKNKMIDLASSNEDFSREQNYLLNQNLSNIPFEEWEGITLVGEDGIDFSKTHANIDLEIINFKLSKPNENNFNFIGCEVKNVKKLNYYDEKMFSEDFVKAHPGWFSDVYISDSARQDYNEGTLSLCDLCSNPGLKKLVKEESFNSASYKFIKMVGFDNAIRLTEENPDIVFDITDINECYFDDDRYEKFFPKDKSNYEEIKRIVYETVIDAMEKIDRYEVDMCPTEEMEEMYPEVFFDYPNYNYLDGCLTIEEIRKNFDLLKDKNLRIGVKHSKGLNVVIDVFGSFQNYINIVPEELDRFVLNYLAENKKALPKIEDSEAFNAIIPIILKHYVDVNSALELTLDELLLFKKYVDISDILSHSKAQFIEFCGLENLIRFNKENDSILDLEVGFNSIFGHISGDALLWELSSSFNVNVYRKFYNGDNSYEDCVKILNLLLLNERKNFISIIDSSSIKENNYVFFKNNKRKLRKAFPSQFLDYDLLDEILEDETDKIKSYLVKELENGINGYINKLPFVLNYNNRLIEVLKGVELIRDSKGVYYSVYQSLGHDMFLDICSKYGTAINVLIDDKCVNLASPYFDGYEERIEDVVYNAFQFDVDKIYKKNFCDSFKKKHPELFISDDAPEDLQQAFYKDPFFEGKPNYGFNPIDVLDKHREYIPYLEHLDLINCCSSSEAFYRSMYSMLEAGFTTKELLNLFADYGNFFINVQAIDISDTKNSTYENVLKQIYDGVVFGRQYYSSSSFPQEFKDTYPDLFIDENAPEDLKMTFYTKLLTADYLQKHPEYKIYLADKNLYVSCDSDYKEFVCEALYGKKLTGEDILDLFERYGFYLMYPSFNVEFRKSCATTLEEAINDIDQALIYIIKNNYLSYGPELKYVIGDKAPELFLDDDAPELLCDLFYANKPYMLTFEQLSKMSTDWFKFLDGKDILVSLQRYNIGDYRSSLERLFEVYGRDKALKIGMGNPINVQDLLRLGKVDEITNWYDKFHFVPHSSVVLNLPFEQSDKFVASGRKWSVIMHDLNPTEEVVSAVLKASICFGVFDNDALGFNKIMELIYSLPISLTSDEFKDIINYLSKNKENDIFDNTEETKKLLLECYKKKGTKYLKVKDPKYYKNNVYMDLVDIVKYKKVNSAITSSKLHKIFGAFKMEYEPDFRDFFLDNLEEILSKDDYIGYISSIQRQWKKIKAFNNNRVLTLELVMDFITSNEFENVVPGNEKLASISNKAGYDEDDFEVLQQIYNYGKLRTFSSIPRVESTYGRYRYEILRLDDPLALAIGTLTDCCQGLNDNAELSMEHSMVSPHGRVFVVFDEEDNIVAQSWVWRNQNVLCFDNIEIPDKAFTRSKKYYNSREEFADEIYKLYEKASKELMGKDNEYYKVLLDDGAINDFQYNSLKLQEITIGKGYNDIADSLKRNARPVEEVRKPLSFSPPVQLHSRLYLDSKEQFSVIKDANVVQSDNETMTIYQDEFEVLDKNSIKEIDKIMLQSLAIQMGNDWEWYIPNYYVENFYEAFADNYQFDIDKMKVLMNANFAIIYEENDRVIKIGDILYNDAITLEGDSFTNVDDIIAMQIRMGLEQIIQDRYLDITRLEDKSQNIYKKAVIMSDRINTVKGIRYGK